MLKWPWFGSKIDHTHKERISIFIRHKIKRAWIIEPTLFSFRRTSYLALIFTIILFWMSGKELFNSWLLFRWIICPNSVVTWSRFCNFRVRPWTGSNMTSFDFLIWPIWALIGIHCNYSMCLNFDFVLNSSMRLVITTKAAMSNATVLKFTLMT